MLKERRRAAKNVAADFLAAERAADVAASLASECVATMLRERTNANLPVATGLDALQLVSEAAADLLKARRRMVEAHASLVEVRSAIGLRALYGDTSDCPPELGAVGRGPATLSVVAA